MHEAFNAATMVPGVVAAVVRLRRSPVPTRIGRLAIGSFVPMCLASMLYHAVDRRRHRALKARLLRLDYAAQQVCAVAHTLAAYPSQSARAATACALAAATSALVKGDKGETRVLFLQTLVVWIGVGLRADRRWLLAFAMRVYGAAGSARERRGGPGAVLPMARWAHGAFHLLVVWACSVMWTRDPFL